MPGNLVTSNPVTVSSRTDLITAPVLVLTLLATMHTPVGPNAALHSVLGKDFGGTRTVPPKKSPDPRSVIPSLRICTLWWYTPGLIRTVSPGLARLTAAWMDWPGQTTIVLDTQADAAVAMPALSPIPSTAAHAAIRNLRMLPSLHRGNAIRAGSGFPP